MAHQLTAEQKTLLLNSAHSYSFGKLMSLIESDDSHYMSVGYALTPMQERVRFRGVPSLAFSVADIDSCHQTGDERYELHVNFMGLYGPSSPLPTFMTEAVIAEDVRVTNEDARVYFITSQAELRSLQSQRLDVSLLEHRAIEVRRKIQNGELDVQRLDDAQLKALREGAKLVELVTPEVHEQFNAQRLVLEVQEKAASHLRDFLDIFNHRLVSLYYRATKKYQPYRETHNDKTDQFTEQLFALIGAPDANERANSPLDWSKLIRFSSLLALKQATAERLSKVIAGYFALEQVAVKEGVLRFAQIPEQQRSRLGQQGMCLSDSFMLGEKVPDRSNKFTVILKGLNLQTFNDFLPPKAELNAPQTGKNYHALKALIEFIAPPQMLYDIALELNEIPEFILGGVPFCRLGWSTWAGEHPQQKTTVIIN